MTKNLQLKLPLLRTWLDGNELVVDNFAGGGGASSGVEIAIGRSPDIAINHDDEAIAMHKANHPECRHYQEDIRDVDPIEACTGPDGKLRPVALAWFSPDCKHFSKAKGCTPKDQEIRGLAWSAVRWAAMVKPRIICLENVEEFKDWGPLDPRTGLAIKSRKGETFNEFVGSLQNLGYEVQWWLLRACDYGAPTSRRRFVMVARCDGKAIVKPEPTHGPGRAHPYRTAAECIEWNVAAPSIFDRKKKHAEKTLARIARGVRKFVLQSPEPFVVTMRGSEGSQLDSSSAPLSKPLRVISASGTHHAVVVPYMVHRSNGERPVKIDPDGTVHAAQAPRVYDINTPLGTIMAQGQKHALVSALLLKHNGGNNDACGASGQAMNKPVDTVTSRDAKSLATVTLGGKPGKLTGETLQRARAVYAFLVRYNGKGEPEALTKPLGTLTTKDRYGLVTVTVDGQEYVVVDIGMRMLTPRELFRAQGFHDSYDITAEKVLGEPLTKTAQVKMCGNSVPPPLGAAVVRAQLAVDHKTGTKVAA